MAPVQVTERCAAHPGRPAVDHCPVCRRARCGADLLPTGCSLCTATPHDLGPVRREAGRLELLVRACLAAVAVALAGGTVNQEYIDAPWFQYAAPAILGVVCAWAAVAAAGNPTAGALSQRVRVASAVYALMGEAFAVLLDKTYDVASTDLSVVLPYLIAAAAAWAWAAPPKPRRPARRRPA